MKKIFITPIIILSVISVYAQSAAPKELTCTEEAFNFSISLGSKWKLGAPKMGPAEILRDDPAYIPGWSFKNRRVESEAIEQPLFATVFNTTNPVYSNRQSANPYSLKIVDKLKNLFPSRPLVGVPASQPLYIDQGHFTTNQRLWFQLKFELDVVEFQ